MIKKYCINCHTLYDTGEETCPSCGFKVTDVKFVMQDGEVLTVNEYAMRKEETNLLRVDLRNKEILEMARVLCDKGLEDGIPCDGAKHICITTRNTATTLYNAGYRNVHNFAKWHAEEQLKLSENVSKETAREILQELSKLANQHESYADRIIDIRASIESFAETFGVEVE